MSNYIKSLIMQYIKNLKKNWILAVICMAVGIVLVISSAGKDGGPSVEGTVGTLVGSQSVSKIEWSFDNFDENKENAVAFETNVSNAKEVLELLKKLVESANFFTMLNEQLSQMGQNEITDSDYFSVSTTGYNGIEILSIGTNPERVKIIEELVRKNFEQILKEHYSAVKLDLVFKPVVLEATHSPDGLGYTLLNQAYVEDNGDFLGEDLEGTNNSNGIFSFSTIIILLSAVALWMAIVLLITIADNKIYVDKDIVNSDLVCYGKLEKDVDYNECIYSTIKRKVEIMDVKNMHLITMGEVKNSVIEEMMHTMSNDHIDMKVSQWGKETIETLKEDEYALLMISSGSCTNEELDKCTHLLNVVDVNNLGCVLC